MKKDILLFLLLTSLSFNIIQFISSRSIEKGLHDLTCLPINTTWKMNRMIISPLFGEKIIKSFIIIRSDIFTAQEIKDISGKKLILTFTN